MGKMLKCSVLYELFLPVVDSNSSLGFCVHFFLVLTRISLCIRLIVMSLVVVTSAFSYLERFPVSDVSRSPGFLLKLPGPGKSWKMSLV